MDAKRDIAKLKHEVMHLYCFQEKVAISFEFKKMCGSQLDNGLQRCVRSSNFFIELKEYVKVGY